MKLQALSASLFSLLLFSLRVCGYILLSCSRLGALLIFLKLIWHFVLLDTVKSGRL